MAYYGRRKSTRVDAIDAVIGLDADITPSMQLDRYKDLCAEDSLKALTACSSDY